MKVRTYGYSLESFCGDVSVETLFESLVARPRVLNQGEHNERRIFVVPDDEYYKGIIVTIKDQKTFCKFQEEGGGFTIEVENLDEKERLMEFNFFLLKKSNGLGLYQHYHNSCGTFLFGSILRDLHKEIRDDMANEQVAIYRQEHGGIDGDTERLIRRRFRRSMKFSLLVRRENIAALLDELHEIKSFGFEYATIDPIVRTAEPLSRLVKKSTHTVKFINTATKAELIRGIVGMTEAYELRKGEVHGQNVDGEPDTIKIFDMPNYFGEEEYDDVASKLNHLDVMLFHNSQVMNDLIRACIDYDHIFGAGIQG